MPRRGQHDQTPGDARNPYSDVGGPAGRHAQTHDVRREELTNPRGPDQQTEDFDHDLHDPRLETGPGHAEESFVAAESKTVHDLLPWLDGSQLEQLAVLQEGTRLEQGGVYLDLRDRDRGPFKAIGGETADAPHLYVAKRDLDHELWNRLTGDLPDVRIDRPT